MTLVPAELSVTNAPSKARWWFRPRSVLRLKLSSSEKLREKLRRGSSGPSWVRMALRLTVLSALEDSTEVVSTSPQSSSAGPPKTT
jgi:hypothetical protein